MSFFYIGLPQRMVRVRENLNLSQNALAHRAEVSHATIRRMELGEGAPAVDTVERVAKALGVDPAWLAFGEDSSVPARWGVPTTKKRRRGALLRLSRRGRRLTGNRRRHRVESGQAIEPATALPEAELPVGSNLKKLPATGLSLKKLLLRVERDLVKQALDRCGGSQKDAADLLQMKHSTLRMMIRRLGIK